MPKEPTIKSGLRPTLSTVAIATIVKIRIFRPIKAVCKSDESVATMRKAGLKVQTVTPEVDAEWRKEAEGFYPKIRGSIVPADLFDEVRRLLQEYRARGKS